MSTYKLVNDCSVQFSSVAQSCPTLCDPMDTAHQASLSITNSQSLLKLMSIKSVMSSNHLILYHPLLPPSVFSSLRVFSKESVLCIRGSKYWSFSFSVSPSNEYSGLIFFRIDGLILLLAAAIWMAGYSLWGLMPCIHILFLSGQLFTFQLI